MEQNITTQIDLSEGRKESIESLRYSTETVMKDNKLKEIFGRTLGGIFGFAILFSSITNVVTDFKSKKRSPWIYSRIILDFTASGALIGYALGETLIGISLGIAIGLIILILEVITKRKN